MYRKQHPGGHCTHYGVHQPLAPLLTTLSLLGSGQHHIGAVVTIVVVCGFFLDVADVDNWAALHT